MRIGYYHTIGIGPTINGATIAPSAIGYLTEQSTGGTYGHLVFATRNVTTDTGPSERMRITSGGNIQITDPNNSTGLKSKISFVSESPYQDEVAFIGFNRTATSGAPCNIVFNTGTASGTVEAMRILSGRQLLLGATTLGTARNDAPVQIVTGSSGNSLNLRTRVSDDVYAYLNFTNNAQTNTAASIHIARGSSTNATTMVLSTASSGTSCTN